MAVMIVQFPLIVLSGYFEGRLDHGAAADFPTWMKIRSRPVRLALTFGFVYVACVAMQTWQVALGPIDPTPPLQWPTAQRAAWFAMFTVGMFFPCYLAATALLLPVVRTLTAPLRALPGPIGGVLALALGGAIGIAAFAAVTSTRVAAFVDAIRAAFAASPSLALAITLATTLAPLALGLVLVLGRRGAPARD
jgi:hypothetical protein